MPDKIFLHILTLCGVWSQGIIGILANEKINVSSDFLVRQKRVVSYVEGEDVPIMINEAPHVVVIKNPVRIHCLGNILSHHVVLTTALCVLSDDPQIYKVIASTSRSNRGQVNNVIGVKKHFGNYRFQNQKGVGLLTINPPFMFSHKCQPIKLHSGPVLPGTIGKVSGFGYNAYRVSNPGTNHPTNLRSIQVPILRHQDCVNRYRQQLTISDTELCTYHPQRHCGHVDFGAGLVVDRELVGIFLWSGLQNQIDPQYPDVFLVLQDVQYNEWIQTNVRDIEAHFYTHI